MADLPSTRLAYFDDMASCQSNAFVLAHRRIDDGRQALILDATIFYPQGGGQPADAGFIEGAASGLKFVVEDVRSKDGLVLHYGFVENCQDECDSKLIEGENVSLHVNEQRRKLNSRLHSAGHLLDLCLRNVGLSHLEPTKGYHFPDGPFVEYKGILPQALLQTKQKEVEKEANALISAGGKVSASILTYEEASDECGGELPHYIHKDSTPRIVKFGDNPGSPCGGTHVADIANIRSLMVTQIRMKKGVTKVFYNIGT